MATPHYRFAAEEIEILRRNPNVHSIDCHRLCFTAEFKLPNPLNRLKMRRPLSPLRGLLFDCRKQSNMHKIPTIERKVKP